MTTIDLILSGILAGFALYGLRFGLVHALGGLIGALISFFIAAKLYLPLAASPFGVLFGGDTNAGRIISFILIYVILARLIGILVWVADRALHFVAVIPGLSLFNRFAGMVFALLEGALVLGGIVYIAGKYPLGESFGVALASSVIATKLNFIVHLVSPLIPGWLAQLRSVFDVPSEKVADYIREYFKF